MKVFYSDKYNFPLPDGHRFPVSKYRSVRKKLIEDRILSETELFEPRLASKEQILLAHTEEYFGSFENGSIDSHAIRKVGFPWSYELHLRSLASVGGAIESAEESLKSGLAGNLAGGTHHAFAGHGEGFCVFNDFAVVINYLQKNNLAQRIAIIDLDVHQGNGNASLLKDNNDVFILDMHGKNNYPFRKIPSTLDIELEDNTEDDQYLEILKENIRKVFEFEPELILYQAGVDTLKEDHLGRLSLSREGLMERDRIVLSESRKRIIPVSLALGGGYSRPIEHTVEAYCNTYKVVKEIFDEI